MTARVVRLGAEGGPRLVDPLEDAHHDLLVQLWALGEERLAAEVVDGEDVRTALARCGDDLRRLDLDEAQSVQGRAIAGERRGGQLVLRPLARVAKRDRRMVENRRQLLLQQRSPEL